MTREELLRSPEYYQTNAQLNLFEAVEDYLSDNEMQRKDFAEQLGVSKGRVSQILNGEFNGRLDRLVAIALAAGRAPVIQFVDLENYVAEDARRQRRAHEARTAGRSVTVARFAASLESAHGVSYKAADYTHSVALSTSPQVRRTQTALTDAP